MITLGLFLLGHGVVILGPGRLYFVFFYTDVLLNPRHQVNHTERRLLGQGLPYLASLWESEPELPNYEIFSTAVYLIVGIPVPSRIRFQSSTRLHS